MRNPSEHEMSRGGFVLGNPRDAKRISAVSVVIATYNGALYVREQLESIYSDLNPGDQVVITDDGSTDETLDIVREITSNYPEIETEINLGPRRGSSANFFSGMSKAKNELIFLSDQDDIWVSGKRRRIVSTLEANNGCKLIAHDAELIDRDGNSLNASIFSIRHPHHGFFSNLLKSSYYGCCMAFHRSLISTNMENIDSIIAHDQFISLLAERAHSAIFMDDILIKHRIHGKNCSKKLKLAEKIHFRYELLKSIAYQLGNQNIA